MSRVTPPVTITELQVISTTAAEPHVPADYAAGTTYAFGAIVKVPADFRIYESLQNDNVGRTPKTSPLWWRIIGVTETAYNVGATYGLGDTVSSNHRCYESLQGGNVGKSLPVLPDIKNDWWLDVGPTNAYAIFDLDRNTQTVTSGPQTIVIKPGERVNTLGLLGMVANQAVISATSVFGGGTVYGPKTINLNTRSAQNGYEFCFEPFSTLPSYAVFDIPPFSDIIITVTLTRTTGNVKCGSFIVGTSIYLGRIKKGAGAPAQNFSTIVRSNRGEATLTRKRSVPVNKYVIEMPSILANKIRNARDFLLNGVPGLWTGLDNGADDWFDTFTMLGPYKYFDVNASENKFGEITLEIEEI